MFFKRTKAYLARRNAGIRIANGQYIAFLDSDDLFLPNKLDFQVTALDKNRDLGLVAGGHIEVDGNLHVLREVRPWNSRPRLTLTGWLDNCPFIVNAVLVRRDWLERAGLFDEKMCYVEDWDLWLRMSHLGCRMDWVNQLVCCYRIHGGNMVRDAQMMKDGMLTMLDKLYAQPNLPSEIICLRSRAYGNVYLNAAARAYASGGAVEGAECLRCAVELNPALLEGNPPYIFASLASFALTPFSNGARDFMDRVVDNLPEGFGVSRWSRHKAHGLLHAVAAFEDFQCEKNSLVLREALLAFAVDPSWVRNRGLLSIAGRSLIAGFCKTYTGRNDGRANQSRDFANKTVTSRPR